MRACREKITSEPVIDVELRTEQGGSINCKARSKNTDHVVEVTNHSPCRVVADIERSNVGGRARYEVTGVGTHAYVDSCTETVAVGARMSKPGPFSSPTPNTEEYDRELEVVSTAPPSEILETDIEYEELNSSSNVYSISDDISVHL